MAGGRAIRLTHGSLHRHSMGFWTPYADWIYTVVSCTLLLLVIVAVLRPDRP